MSQIAINSDLLCSPIITKTNVPLVTGSLSGTSETLNVSACSELKKYALPVTHFDATQKLHFVLDGDQQPLLFTLGKDSRFYCIHHVSGRSWTSHDITAGDSDTSTATSFHVVQHNSGLTAAAVAVKKLSGGTTDLYYAKPFDPSAKDFDPSAIPFSKISKNGDDVAISALTLASADATMKSCVIMVGTSATNTKLATNYIVTPGNDEANWRTLSLHEDSTIVLKTLAVTLRKPYYGCTATLYKSSSNSSVEEGVGTALSCSSTDKDQTYNITVYLNAIGGGARDVAMAMTPLGLSDLYVAGLKGIGYYASQLLTKDPTVILPGISFQQVVAVEKILDKDKSQISVFAVSVSGDMYFIQGLRPKRGKVPVFETPDVPIRTDVGFLSTQYDAALDAVQAVYVSTKDTQVKHILRDPGTTLWAGQVVHVAWKDEVTVYDALETRVSFLGSSGTAVGSAYRVALTSSQLSYALVNDKSYLLGSKPLLVETDGSGSIRVVIQADPGISSPTLHFKVGGDGQSQIVKVDPRQRITSHWSKFSSGADLKNAKSTTGEAIFANTKIPDSTFDAVVETLLEASKVLSNPNPDGTYGKLHSQFYNASGVCMSADMHLPLHMAAFSFGDWVRGAIDAVGKAIGDVVEAVVSGVEKAARAIGEVVEKVVKVGVAVVNGVVNFVATIAGKAYRWALSTAGHIVHGIIAVLKDTLGLDATRFFALFGFWWDHENIIKTQKIIARTATEGAPILKRVVSNNIVHIKDAIKNSRSMLKSELGIEDHRFEEQSKVIDFDKLLSTLSDSPVGRVLSPFIHNPIIQEVMSFTFKWISKAACLLDNLFQLPGVGALSRLVARVTEIAAKFVVDEVKNIGTFGNDVISKIKELFSGKRNIGEFFSVLLSDAFWTVFDAMETAVDAFLDILAELVTTCLDMCTGVIVIPGVSAFWKAFNDTEFSVLNVLSMSMAQLLYLFTMLWKGVLPFDLMRPWYELLPSPETIILRADATVGETTSLFSDTERSKRSIPPRSNLKPERSENQGKPETDNTGAIVDLCATVISSIAVLTATALSLPDSPMSIPNEDDPVYGRGPFIPLDPTDIPTMDGAPLTRRDMNLSFTKAVEWMQVCFNGISLISELVLLIRGWSSNAYNKYFKGLAVVLKGIDLVLGAGHLKGTFVVPPVLQTCHKTLSPVGNGLNALCGFIDFLYSDKLASDDVGLLVTISGGVGATLDFATVIVSAAKQKEIAIITIGSSFVVNLFGCLGGSLVVVCLKTEGKW